MIRLQFQYAPEDLAEEAKARVAAMAGQTHAQRSAAARRQRTIRTWLFLSMLVVWVGLLTAFLVLRSSQTRGTVGIVTLPVRSVPSPTHNLRSTVIPPIVAPLLFGALTFAAMARGVVPQRVPFYTPEQPSQRLNRHIYGAAAVVSLVVAIVLVVEWWRSPLEPDWRPERMTLVYLQFGPWLAFLMLLVAVITAINRRVQRATLGPEGFWARQPHTVEIDQQAVEARRGHTANRMGWPYFVSYLETENLFVLYTADLTMLILPKRAFATIEQSDQFRGLVVNQVPRGEFLPLTTGFPVARARGLSVAPSSD